MEMCGNIQVIPEPKNVAANSTSAVEDALGAGGGFALETVSFQHEKESRNETPIC